MYLVTRGDIEKIEKYPSATLDENGRLRVLFAVDTWPGSYGRVEKGFEAGADGVVVDTSQGFTKFAFDMLEYIAQKYPKKLLIGGNISTAEAARELHQLGFVDAYRCGQGSGSICTTTDEIGLGRAGATGVYECTKILAELDSKMTTIADGGIRTGGDIIKALALGAGAVMLGSMLAGSEECPGQVKFDHVKKIDVKEYWGMGSDRAKVGGAKRARDYGAHEEGIEKTTPYKGSIHVHLPRTVDAIRHAFEVLNYSTINDLQQGVRKGGVRFGKRRFDALVESRPYN